MKRMSEMKLPKELEAKRDELAEKHSNPNGFKRGYWIVEDDCVMFFKKFSPQCNPNEAVSLNIRDRLYPKASVLFIPVAYVEQDFNL